MLPPEIQEYYERGGERHRLASGQGRLEFLRTWDILTRHLPAPPATVLDVGGGTGAYARPLAQTGYDVHVVDPVPGHVAEAAAVPGLSAAVGEARALPVGDDSVDAVLLLGPLYHLLERADRVAAWRETGRALRPGGVAVGAVISRFGSLFDGFIKGYLADGRFRRMVEHTLSSGEHRNIADDRSWFTTAYFHRPDEVAEEVTDAGLMLHRLLAVESPLWMDRAHLDELVTDTDRVAQMLEMLRLVEDEPSLLGASGHLLAVARR